MNERRILDFKKFVINENTKISDLEYSYSLLNEANVSRSEIDKIRGLDLKTFLLKTLWNQSVEMFYGKGYKGDPQNDPTIITTGGTPWALGMSGHGNETAGAVFRDCWKETDDFINRTVELIETGTISDFWGKFGKIAGWAGIAAAVATAAIFLPVTIPVISGSVISTGFAGLTAFTAGGSTSIAAFASLGANALMGTYLGAGISTFTILSQKDSNFNSAYQVLNNKEKFVNDVKGILSNHSDFEADWGLDSWLAGIQGMPGWRKGKMPQVINWDAEKIGWLFIDMMARATHSYVSVKTITEVTSALMDMGYEIKDNGEAIKSGSGKTQTTSTTTATQPLKSDIQNPIDYNLLSNFWINTKVAQKDSTGNIVKVSSQPDSLTTIISKFYGIVHNWKMGGYPTVNAAMDNIKKAMGNYWSDNYQYTLYDILTNRSGSATAVKAKKVAKSGGSSQKSSTTTPSGVKGSSDNIRVDDVSTSSYNL